MINVLNIMKQKGFTLIELLVVVAIIGILATIVLSSLGSARMKAKDSAVQASLSNYRSAAELEFNDGDYTDLCSSSESFTTLVYGILDKGGDVPEEGGCISDNTSYRIIATLPSATASLNSYTAYAAGEDAFCINSNGMAVKGMYEDMSALTAPACSAAETGGGGACLDNCFCVNTCTNECNYFVAPNSFGNYGAMPQPECSGAPDCTVGNPPCK